MVKIWGGSGRRTVRSGAKRADAAIASYAGADEQNVIDFDTLLSWYTEYNLMEAAGNERIEPRSYTQKRKSLKFLSL